jgi:threonine synthase
VTADAGEQPFVAHRHHLDLYRAARAAGWSDRRWVEAVTELDQRVAAVDGTGLRTTPVVPVATATGPVLAKVETGNVAGSHKARHLFGLALDLAVAGEPAGRELAIASCGNAALAAATVARAVDRPLRVFVPAGADPAVVDRLAGLGARITTSRRRPGERGDPCVRDLHQAIAAGARPFTVQGALCPAAIDGARTLGLELARQLGPADPAGQRSTDDTALARQLGPADPAGQRRPAGTGSAGGPRHLFVQVGGGALATATMEGLARAGAAGGVVLHPVQALAAHPFVAAWRRLLAWRGLRHDPPDPLEAGPEVAALMEPWPTEPRSVATGILDDVTYDWLPVASWTLRTGGWPVLADEATLLQAAAEAAASATPPPDATGAAGLAGALTARREGTIPPGAEVVVLLTGVDRSWEAAHRRDRR